MCDQDINRFCFICSLFTIKDYRVPIDIEIIKMFKECFDESMRNLDSDFSPDIICKICKNYIYKHLKEGKALPISSPARWRDPRIHPNDCFNCNTKTVGFNHKNRKSVKYFYGYACTASVFGSNNKLTPIEEEIEIETSTSDQTVLEPEFNYLNKQSPLSNPPSSPFTFDPPSSPLSFFHSNF